MAIYLGDAVYAEKWQDGVVLYTSNGETQENRIYLDGSVLYSLLDWVGKLPKK